jgi:hypothetical protein
VLVLVRTGHGEVHKLERAGGAKRPLCHELAAGLLVGPEIEAQHLVLRRVGLQVDERAHTCRVV